MIKKILVPIDGSAHADRALDFALDLAQKYSADILILTVLQYRMGIAQSLPQDIETESAYFDNIREYHERMLSESLEKAKKNAPDVNVSTKITEGYPADIIIDTANEEGFDTIVMGRRGQGHLTHTLLGSVSDRVADMSPCALILIK